MKMLKRVIKFVIDTQNRKLILKPNQDVTKWKVKGYSDSDFAGDTDE